MNNYYSSRRRFIKKSALGMGAAMMAPSLIGKALSEEKKLGVALVGLGYYAEHKIAVGLQESKFCKLAGAVTGTPEKVDAWAKKFNLPKTHIYNYENFDKIKDNPDIDIVYVVLPNSMHAEFTVRAAEAGKHVICEKPMEVSVAKAQMMVDACKRAGKLLQIGYRCQYDPYHLEFMRIGREKLMGDIKSIHTNFSFYGVNSKNWRFTDKSLSGGGPLMDVGVYCIQGARYAMGVEPVAITAQAFKTHKDLMPGMEESINWQMEFPGEVFANCSSSYVDRENFIRVSASKGNYGLAPAYSYTAPEGYMGKEAMSFERHNQQAVQMDAFARNILDGTSVIASGEEGVRDMKVVEAIYKAAEMGERVRIF